MKAFVLAVLLAFVGCSTVVRVSELSERYAPQVVWLGNDAITFALGSIEEKGHLILIVAELVVNGQAGHFILDTGASKSWVRREFADKMGLDKNTIRMNNRGAGGQYSYAIVVDRLDFGFVRVEHTFLALGDLFTYENRQLGVRDEIDGLLGLDLLHALGAEIDVVGRRVTFRKWPDQALEPTTPAVIPRAPSSMGRACRSSGSS